jgi:UDP-glucose 4-epimerase
LLAATKAPVFGFKRFVISAPTPFDRSEAAELRSNPSAVVQRYCPQFGQAFEKMGWRMAPSIERVYDSTLARDELEWKPKYSFCSIVERLSADGADAYVSDLAKKIGRKGYHRTANN